MVHEYVPFLSKKGVKMKDLHVRDIEEGVLHGVDRLAKKHNMSRSEYVRQLLKNKTLENDILAIQERYESLVKTILDVLELQTERMNEILEKVSLK